MTNQPAFKAALVFACGILLGRFSPLPTPFPPAVFLCLFIVLAFLMRKKKNSAALQSAAVLMLLLSAFLRYRQVSAFLPAGHIARHLTGRGWVELKSFLVKDPVQKAGRVELLVEALAVRGNPDDSLWTEATGKVLVPFYEPGPCPLRYGDEIMLRGRLERPRPRSNPGGFDYRAYLERRGIHAILKSFDPLKDVQGTGPVRGSPFMRKAVYPVRRSILRTVSRTCDAETGPVLRALLVGDQGSIPDDVREGFSRAGAVHILSVSGSHAGFVLLILTTAFGLFRIPQPFRTFLTLAGLGFYCLLAEANAPVVRATLMASVVLLGRLSEKKTNPFNVIGFSALACLAWAPRDLFDVNFQLSYASVLSIVFFYQKLKSIVWMQRVEKALNPAAGRLVYEAVLVSTAAQIGTIPLIAFYFNQIPLLSAFANLAAIPLSGLIVALGVTSCLFAPLCFSAAAAYGTLNHALLLVFIRFLVWLGNRPFSNLVVPSPNAFQAGLFAGAALLAAGRDRRTRKAAVAVILISAGVLAWKPVLDGQHTMLTWIQFDVGQGDAALFRFPGDENVLVDGGGRTPDWDAGERVLIPYLAKEGIRRLAAVVLTHPHDDHAGGLVSVIQRVHVDRIFVNGDSVHSPIQSEWTNGVRKKRIPVDTVRAMDILFCRCGARIVFLPQVRPDLHEDVNDRSLVLRVFYGRRKLLLMGDAGRRVEADLIASGMPLESDVIKIGHHGSETSSSDRFIRAVGSATALVSVGRNNRFGHPSKRVMEDLRNNGIHVIRTDSAGAVTIRTDGETIRLEQTIR